MTRQFSGEWIRGVMELLLTSPDYSVMGTLQPGMKEVKISASMSEFVPETIPSDRAVVAWTVDTTSRGPFQHPTNGMTFQIQGMKKSWRLIGDPELARTKINWWGPW